MRRRTLSQHLQRVVSCSRLAFCALLVVVLGGEGCSGRAAQLRARLSPTYDLVEDGLYMGGQVSQPPPGTQAVLNLSEDPDPYAAPVHRWEPIPDGPPAPNLEWLRTQVSFVDEQRRQGKTVYVHCKVGVSRSGMVVVAYEMWKNHWTFDQALAFVRSKRSIVRPNPAFRPLLEEWERVVLGAPGH